MVEVAELFAVTPVVGLAVAVELAALTAPATKPTVGCCVMVVPAMVTVMVFVSAFVDRIVKVVWPLAAVTAGTERVLPVPVELAVTVAPEIKLLLASLAVTVMVEVVELSAATPVLGLATAVELAALGGGEKWRSTCLPLVMTEKLAELAGVVTQAGAAA